MNISLPPHNKPPMIAARITSRSASLCSDAAQQPQHIRDKGAGGEKPLVLSVTFSLSAVVPLLRGLALFLPRRFSAAAEAPASAGGWGNKVSICIT